MKFFRTKLSAKHIKDKMFCHKIFGIDVGDNIFKTIYQGEIPETICGKKLQCPVDIINLNRLIYIRFTGNHKINHKS